MHETKSVRPTQAPLVKPDNTIGLPQCPLCSFRGNNHGKKEEKRILKHIVKNHSGQNLDSTIEKFRQSRKKVVFYKRFKICQYCSRRISGSISRKACRSYRPLCFYSSCCVLRCFCREFLSEIFHSFHLSKRIYILFSFVGEIA